MSQSGQGILFISNGNGEDKIGSQLALAWQLARPQDKLQALAVVGEGHYYRDAQIPLLPCHFSPPSAGFAYLNPFKLAQDFRAGLGGHLGQIWQQLGRVETDCVIAIGDIVAVGLAKRTRKPFAFIGCALSDYYTHGQRNTYDPLQRLWLKNASLGIYARDLLTTRALQAKGLPAEWQGNPMLDAIEYGQWFYQNLPGRIPIGIAPGSHSDAVANFQFTLTQLEGCLNEPYDFLCALVSESQKPDFERVLVQSGWCSTAPKTWQKENAQLCICVKVWGNILNEIKILIGLAGTANEQSAGFGIPIISFTSSQLQYSARFAEAQTRLLGPALHWLQASHPDILAACIKRILNNPIYSHAAQEVGQERFGSPGAVKRIVDSIQAKRLFSGVHFFR
jgi:uncharacterized protein (TIGR03492 family)